VDTVRGASVVRACSGPIADGEGEAVLSQSGIGVRAVLVGSALGGPVVGKGVAVAGRSADVGVVEGNAPEGVADGEAIGKLVTVTEDVANVPVGVGDGVPEGISVGTGVREGGVSRVAVGVLVPPVGVTVGMVWLSRSA